MIVTIDGPAGAGKSSAARQLAARLGFEFLDTGAMYRAVTFAAIHSGIDCSDQQAVTRLLDDLRLEMPAGRIIVNDLDVSASIRTAEVADAVGPIADSPIVRRRLDAIQRQVAAGRNIVTEGRDQGTIVFLDAGCKFFLVADPRERALRRQREMTARGDAVDFERLLASIIARDARDAARDLAPMKPADDAVVLDSTALTLDQVVDRMEAEVRRRMT
jgi:cytidylate kinase